MAILVLALCGTATEVKAAPMLELIEVGQDIKINFYGNTLYVTGGAEEDLVIYNILGMPVFSAHVDSQSKRFDLHLSKGCYIVKVGKVAHKISIR